MSDLCHGNLHPRVVEGLELFNAGKYFEAHEALEDAWRETREPIRELYRGILQAAVVYLHISRNNYLGAIKVYVRSQKWLVDWPETCRGVNVGKLRRDLGEAVSRVRELGADQLSQFDLNQLKPVDYDPQP